MARDIFRIPITPLSSSKKDNSMNGEVMYDYDNNDIVVNNNGTNVSLYEKYKEKILNNIDNIFGPASSSTAGKSGLVPAPAAGKQNQFLRGDGTWATPTNTTYSVFKGASVGSTGYVDGSTGLVPAPSGAKYNCFLRGDATWQQANFVSVTAATSITNSSYALSAIHANPNVSGSLAAQIASIGTGFKLVKEGSGTGFVNIDVRTLLEESNYPCLIIVYASINGYYSLSFGVYCGSPTFACKEIYTSSYMGTIKYGTRYEITDNSVTEAGTSGPIIGVSGASAGTAITYKLYSAQLL